MLPSQLNLVTSLLRVAAAALYNWSTSATSNWSSRTLSCWVLKAAQPVTLMKRLALQLPKKVRYLPVASTAQCGLAPGHDRWQLDVQQVLASTSGPSYRCHAPVKLAVELIHVAL